MSAFEKGEGRRSVDRLDEGDEKMFSKESENIQAAMTAGEDETNLSRKALFKLHWPAAMWSCLLR